MTTVLRVCLCALVTIGLGLAALAPGATATEDPALAVKITAITPNVLSDEADPDAEVTVRGTLDNVGPGTWNDLEIRFVVPRNPLTLFHEFDATYADDVPVVGTPVPGHVAVLDRLDPGSQHPWSLTIPRDALSISGAEGVYPVSVEVHGTAPDGTVSAEPIAADSTFLPLVGPTAEPVETTVVIPLLGPAESDELHPVDAVAADAERLSRVIDAASAIPAAGRTVVVDPHLIDLLDRAEQTEVLDRLLELVRDSQSYVLDYAHPDQTVLAARTSAELLASVDRATRHITERFSISAPRASRIQAGTLTESVLAQLPDRVVFAWPTDVPDWRRMDGSVVTAGSRSVVVTAPLPGPGREGPAAITAQRLLSTAALTDFTRRVAPTAADRVAVVLPTRWEPGDEPGALAAAFDADFVHPVTIADQISTAREYTGAFGGPSQAVISVSQVQQAQRLLDLGDLMARLDVDAAGALVTTDQAVSAALSTRWIDQPEAGLAATRSASRMLADDLEQISVSVPSAVTLSSATGSFPLTISNLSDRTISVGVNLDPSNRGIRIEPVNPIEVEPGSRRTIDVSVDMVDQQSTVMIARPVTADGETFGDLAVFNLRASNVGTIIWVALGVATAGFVATIARRFWRSSRTRSGGDDEPLH